MDNSEKGVYVFKENIPNTSFSNYFFKYMPRSSYSDSIKGKIHSKEPILGCPSLNSNPKCSSAIVLSRVWLFATLWTVAHQTPLSKGFSRQEYWSGLPFPSPGDFPDPGIKPVSPVSPALWADSLPTEPSGPLDVVTLVFPLFSDPKNHCQDNRQGDYCLCFLLEI